jgi:hypothetical protein
MPSTYTAAIEGLTVCSTTSSTAVPVVVFVAAAKAC